MKNTRNAGRKPIIDNCSLDEIISRSLQGESISSLATEFGVSRQALYKRIRSSTESEKNICIDYYSGDKKATRIEVDFAHEKIHVLNYAIKISERAFGINSNPSWEDFEDFLWQKLLLSMGLSGDSSLRQFWVNETAKDYFSLEDIVDCENTGLKSDDCFIDTPVFSFKKNDLITGRTDTDGYQMKALSKDRRWFVKSQAVIGGELMDDWAVELIASDFCKQLSIPCIEQRRCEIAYAGKRYDAVYSQNFELDGYSFISFERLLERQGLSSNDEEFIKLNAIEKLKWCAKKLSVGGNLPYESAEKYMLDIALIDCLIGNVDRHTKNFGLFFNAESSCYEIPLIFDNGMGLFEHDRYKNSYMSFEDAMRNVYVSPYGEDPFDMIKMLDTEYDLISKYPKLSTLTTHSEWMSTFAKKYLERMMSIWQK